MVSGLLSPERRSHTAGTVMSLEQMEPQANFNLVLLPPESDSLVTQVDIWGVRCARGERKISRAIPGDSSWGRGRAVRQKGWLLFLLEEGTGRETNRKRKRDSREETQKHKTEQNPEEHKTPRKRREQEADQEEVEEAAEEEEEEEEEAGGGGEREGEREEGEGEEGEEK